VYWHEIIKPSTVNIIVGQKGHGKSALAYYLVEDIAPKHKLLPIIVGFPREKQSLLPDGYVIKDIEDALVTENAMILVDEGTTQLPAGGKLEEFVKACSSLSRQREQIILFIFHSSRDIGSRILRGIDAVIIKEPSRRQIQQGAKDKWFRETLIAAKEQISKQEKDKRQYSYVDSENPDYTGLLENPLPSFWNEDLSKAWRGMQQVQADDAITGIINDAVVGTKKFPLCSVCNLPAHHSNMVGGKCRECRLLPQGQAVE